MYNAPKQTTLLHHYPHYMSVKSYNILNFHAIMFVLRELLCTAKNIFNACSSYEHYYSNDWVGILDLTKKF